MERLLRAQAGEISLIVEDADGDQVPATGPGGAGLPSVAVVDSAGAPVAGSPFASLLRGGTTGTYDAQIPPGATAVLDEYEATWTFRSQGITVDETERRRFKVVGAHLFTVAQLRATDPELASSTNYPGRVVIRARDHVEERFEEITGIAFTPQGRRVSLQGSGNQLLTLPDLYASRVVSAVIDGVALGAPALADITIHPAGFLERKTLGAWVSGPGLNTTVFYEYGLTSPPDPIVRGGLLLARHLLLRKALENERATAVFTDIGGYRLSIAGREGPTGLPEVDAVLAEYARPAAAFA
ncbi:MAG: hypothetical protein ACRDH8_12940 [Actinomycetota bacterium]